MLDLKALNSSPQIVCNPTLTLWLNLFCHVPVAVDNVTSDVCVCACMRVCACICLCGCLSFASYMSLTMSTDCGNCVSVNVQL